MLAACLCVLAARCGQCADNSKSSPREAFLRSEFQEYGLAEAQAEVEALKRLVAEQEAHVESIKSTLWQPALGTCGAQGQECARGDEAVEMEEQDEGGGGKKERRRKAEKSKKNKPVNQAENFRAVARFRLPKGAKPTGLKWLPYPNSNSPVREMNRLLVASDSKGSLHFFDDAGRHISSHQTGSSSIASMSVSGKWDGELKVFTAGSGGEVRTFSVSPPPRHIAPPDVILEHSRVIDERLAMAENSKLSGAKLQPDAAAKWEPMILEVSRFLPTKVEMLPWDNSSKATADLSGPPKPIKFVDYVQRGKISYNTIVGDSEGRVSVHIRNGTLLSSFHIPGGKPPPDHRGCVLSTGSWTAVCAKTGLAFYSVQPRHLHPARCHAIPAAPSPEDGAESAEGGGADVDDQRGGGGGGGGGGGKKASGGKRREQIATEPVMSEIVSLASDVSSPSTVYAGTKDGRMLVLQVKGDGTRLRCTVVNDMAVSLKPAPVLVSSIKGFAFATVAATGDSTLPPSLSVYNVSNGGASRRSPPNLLLHIPLEHQGGDKGAVLIHTDRRTGIAVLGPNGEGFIYKYSHPVNPSSEMLFSVLNLVKSPAVVILVAGIVFWQVLIPNQNIPPPPLDFSEITHRVADYCLCSILVGSIKDGCLQCEREAARQEGDSQTRRQVMIALILQK